MGIYADDGTMKSKNPCVSVVIPAYQSADTLPRAIKSVLDQDFTDYELIIVDNGSTDSTASIISEAINSDPRIRGVHLEVNQRPAGGRNTGVENARGEYIAFLDADDEWLPGKLSTQVALLNKFPDYDLVFTDSWIVNLNGGKKYRHSSGNESVLSRLNFEPVSGYEKAYLVSGQLTQMIYTKSFINMSTSLLRKEKFIRAGGFNQERFGTEDIDFWVRYSRNSKFIYWHQPTAQCYQGEGTSKPGEGWLSELIRYHRACLTSPDYDGLHKIAKQNLLKIYRYLIVGYGLENKTRKAFKAFYETLDLGFNPRLCLYTGLTLFGPIPFKIGLWYTSNRKKHKEQAKPLFSLEKFNE